MHNIGYPSRIFFRQVGLSTCRMVLSMYMRQCSTCFRIVHSRMLSPQPLSSPSVRCKQTQSEGADEDPDKPLMFSQSKAAAWKAQFTREGRSEPVTEVETPWYQGYVIILSLTVFMLHFCVLREENDIDEELGKSLYDRIEGLEEHQLKMSLQYNLEKGLDTTAIEARLKEIESAK